MSMLRKFIWTVLRHSAVKGRREPGQEPEKEMRSGFGIFEMEGVRVNLTLAYGNVP